MADKQYYEIIISREATLTYDTLNEWGKNRFSQFAVMSFCIDTLYFALQTLFIAKNF